jgi:hypothetical protein
MLSARAATSSFESLRLEVVSQAESSAVAAAAAVLRPTGRLPFVEWDGPSFRLNQQQLASCFDRRPYLRAPSSGSSCVNLNVAATGSESLHTLLLNEPAFARYHDRARVPLSESRLPGHRHMSVAEWRAYARAKSLPQPECFIMTVRDPAARLASAFRYECQTGHTTERGTELSENVGLMHLLGPRQGHNRTLHQFVARLQRPADRVAQYYAMHAGAIDNHKAPVNNNPFIKSQLAYLDGLDCSAATIHLVCTEQLTTDWTSLVQRLARGPTTVNTSWGHQHWRSREHKCRDWILTEKEKTFLRKAAYPWDWMLHEWACGPGSGAVHSETFSTSLGGGARR